ncbi:acetylxylan esterase [Psychromonas sp.]|nr:acetylxylan esterase [Psychromonas sp.]
MKYSNIGLMLAATIAVYGCGSEAGNTEIEQVIDTDPISTPEISDEETNSSEPTDNDTDNSSGEPTDNTDDANNGDDGISIFTSEEISLDDIEENVSFSADIKNYIDATDLTDITFSMSNAPDWLSLSSDGTLSGTPSEDKIDDYSWKVTVSSSDAIDTATFALTVRSSEWFEVIALSELTNVPTVYDINGNETTIDTESGEIQEIYYQGLNYQGKETRVYAYVGIPTGITTPVPAMVLVHGGGGTAYSTWVSKWMDRGYAAISMSVEGEDGAGETHEWAGPARDGNYNDTYPGSSSYVDVPDQWMYHAVADTMLANSLMASLNVIDENKVGLMGISWGGVITSTVMGLDNRFALAIPVYGCGHLYDADNTWSANLSSNTLYQTVWDPMMHLNKADMPSLWMSWSGDNNFGMDSFAYNYEVTTGAHMPALRPEMGHSHNAAWKQSDSYEFAKSIFDNDMPWFKNLSQTESAQDGDEVSMTFTSTKSLVTNSLRYTTGTGYTGDLEWLDKEVTLNDNSNGTYTITATLPEGTTGWYFSLSDNDVYVSSDYIENVELISSPSDELVLEVTANDNSASGFIDLSFTGPTNIDIQSIEFSESEHLNAFSSNLTPEIELNSDASTETLTVTFDNSLAGLAAGSNISANITFTWETLAGGSKALVLPITVSIAE